MTKQILLTELSFEDFKALITETVAQAFQKFKPLEPQDSNDSLMKIDEVAKFLAVSKVTIHAWKKKGILPFHRLGGRVYYKLHEVKESLSKIQKKEVFK